MRRLQESCLSCGGKLNGRIDKKYCDPQCKSAHQYKKEKEQPKRFYNKVDNQLKLNRRLLKQYNKAGKAVIRQSIMISAGFNPKFFTHYWKSKKGEVYLFVYEYGFLRKKDNHADKFILIKWQEYMY